MENPELLGAVVRALGEAGLVDLEADHGEYERAVHTAEVALGAARAWEAEHDARPVPAAPRLVALETTDVPGLEPLQAIRLTIGPDKQAFVFTLSEKARLGMTQSRLENMAQVIGNLVHPAQATLIVLPDGVDLAAYEVQG